MKKLVLTLLIGITTLTAFSQNAFSFKRQLNYQQCKKCYCKKSRKYSIISTNLTSSQMVCAQEDNRSNLSVKEMFQNGTSSGLFGGSNPRQEGCGNDCYHEFINAKDEVETVKINECLTENQRQINRNEQKKAQEQEQREEDDKEQIANNEQKRINELRTSAWNDQKQNNLILSIEKYKEIVAYNIKNKTHKYYDQEESDLEQLSWMLIKTKQFEEAFKYSSEAVNNSYWTPLNLDVNYCHSILLSNKNMDEYWRIVKYRFDGNYPTSGASDFSPRIDDFRKGKKFLEIMKEDYKFLDSIGVKDSRFPGIIDKMEQEFEQRWKGYGVVFSKYFSQTSYAINDNIRKNMQNPVVRFAHSTKIGDNFYYFKGRSNIIDFYFIFPNNKSGYSFSQEALEWKGTIIILNSFNMKNNEAPSDKIIAKTLNRKIELEKVIELEKGIIFENNTHFFSGH